MLYRSDGRKNWKFEKRMQNEDKHLNFHLHNTFCLPVVYTKFHNPKSSSCWENWPKKTAICVIRSDRSKIEKEGKMSFSIFIFIYTIHLAYLKVCTKFKNTGSNRSREICERNFHLRERKMNKYRDWYAICCCFLLHNTTHYYQASYQISES